MEDVIALVFEEWHRRWTEDPAGFADKFQTQSEPSDEYGVSAAAFFRSIADDLGLSL
jgi:hypothetical protein